MKDPDRFNLSGSKYLREFKCMFGNRADVYAVLEAFSVVCPARQHAIKKLLCSGIRGKGGSMQDLTEARDAIDRAIQMETSRQVFSANTPTIDGNKYHDYRKPTKDRLCRVPEDPATERINAGPRQEVDEVFAPSNERTDGAAIEGDAVR